MAASLSEETLHTCPVCRGTGSTPIFSYPEGYLAAGVLTVYRCDHCSIAYLNPRLTIASTIAVENESTVYDLTPAEIDDRLVGLDGTVSDLSSFAPRRGRLLDMGCNRGLLLEAARRQGWEPVGVELSPVSAQRARDDFGLEVYGSLDDVKQLERFDLVVAWHVLEHTHDPVGFLRDAASLLRSDGVLALQVPSFDFVEEFRARSQIYSIACAVHTFYFTEQNIGPILGRAGLAARLIRNDPNDLMLTVICARQASLPRASTVQSTLLHRAYDSLRYRGPASLARETRQYLAWRWHLLVRGE
jgi:SAM-dependent methyltransferase